MNGGWSTVAVIGSPVAVATAIGSGGPLHEDRLVTSLSGSEGAGTFVYRPTVTETEAARAAGDGASIEELVHRVREGDGGAEEELVRRFSRGLLAYLRRLDCPPELADDVHQESFRIVLERLRGPGLEEPAGLAGFLRGTARRVYVGECRKVARRKTDAAEEVIAQTEDPRSGQLHQVLDAEAATLVRQLIGELDSPRDRQILYRFYIAEDKKESICEDFGLSSLHFNRVLFRARRRFKEILEGFAERENLRWAS